MQTANPRSHFLPPRFIRHWAVTTSRLGNGLLYGILASFFAFRYNQKTPILSSFLAISIGQFFLHFIKRRARRQRPSPPALWHSIRPWKFDLYSFPSGHALTAFAFCTTIAYWYPVWRIPLYFIATNVAASRVVLRLHYLSDAIAGAVLGTFSAGLALWLMGNWEKLEWIGRW